MRTLTRLLLALLYALTIRIISLWVSEILRITRIRHEIRLANIRRATENARREPENQNLRSKPISQSEDHNDKSEVRATDSLPVATQDENDAVQKEVLDWESRDHKGRLPSDLYGLQAGHGVSSEEVKKYGVCETCGAARTLEYKFVEGVALSVNLICSRFANHDESELDTDDIAQLERENLWPGNDGKKLPYDPTHGRIDRDIQWSVEETYRPTTTAQRVAMENTIQDQRNRTSRLHHQEIEKSGSVEIFSERQTERDMDRDVVEALRRHERRMGRG